MTESAALTVEAGRNAVSDILAGRDRRAFVVVGPCSIHDPASALEYGDRLKRVADEVADDLVVIMRVYFEKPRTTVGWKGLINDPDLDGTFNVNKGLRIARQLLSDLTHKGLPVGTEFLDPFTPQFVSGLVSWGAIGARTTESQTHRELASGLSMPIGFKNGTDGTVQIAIDAVTSSAHPHHFLGVTEQGLAGIVSTKGNKDCHVILRGGKSGPNYDAESVARVAGDLKAARLLPCVMVDCSHGNSNKDFSRQPLVAQDAAKQIAAGQNHLIGVMVESHLVEGSQKLSDPKSLTYGQSVTDACINFETTVPLLKDLAAAVRERRSRVRTTWEPPAIG